MESSSKHKLLTAYAYDDYVVTTDINGEPQNYSAHHWVTSMYGSDIQLLLNVNTAIYAYDEDMARRIINAQVDTVIKAAKILENANANLSVTPSTQELREQHALLQMEYYGANGNFNDLNLIERTNAQVTLCQQFGVKNLAKLISQYENVNIRTIHERIQRLRKDSTYNDNTL